MSDLGSVTSKVQEGIDWRGTIIVEIDGEEHELTVRQLRDPEFREVMELIDEQELQELQGQLPEGAMEEYRELQNEDEEMTDEERERFEELRDELQGSTNSIFDVLSEDTFEGIRKCAKYAVVPDEEDVREAFVDRASEIESEYGVKVQEPEDVKPALEDDIDEMIENSTNLISFTIGIQALIETIGEDEGNSDE
jgi:Tfp pilus assembly protein FimV